MKIATRWKLILGMIILVAALVTGVLALQEDKLCSDWQSNVRKITAAAGAAAPPALASALERERPSGCADVLHG
ncbi:MAG: hypothetical protein M3P18_12250 [Actinomycetota bacterium]|nr:hypothetical protein [Actinomycetota bacterium]